MGYDQWVDGNVYCVRPKIYGEEYDCEIEKVKTLYKDLVREYEMNMKGKKLVSLCQVLNINASQSLYGRKLNPQIIS